MEIRINTDDVLNFTAHCESYLRVGLVKAIMYQMSTEELDKLKGTLSHAHGRHAAKERAWIGPKSSDGNSEGTVALDSSMIDLPVIPDRFVLQKMTKQPLWWKKFGKSRFIAMDVECVQHKEFYGQYKDKAAIVSIVDREGTVYTERITWPREKIVINEATKKINGITYESLSEGKSFKHVKDEVTRRIRDKIVVTVGGNKDFRSLGLDELEHRLFDLQEFYYRRDPNNASNVQGMSLRDMCFYHFSQDCQQGTHSACNDAINTLRVFLKGYTSSQYTHLFWNDDGSRKIGFDGAKNLKTLERRGVIWSNDTKSFIQKKSTPQ